MSATPHTSIERFEAAARHAEFLSPRIPEQLLCVGGPFDGQRLTYQGIEVDIRNLLHTGIVGRYMLDQESSRGGAVYTWHNHSGKFLTQPWWRA